MSKIGTIENLWRYPVKSMRGEKMENVFMGFPGIFGDRCFAFKNSASRKGFPYLSATAQEIMLRYQPKFRYPEKSVKPPNLAEAMKIQPGVNPADGNPEDFALDVLTPSGEVLPLDSPALAAQLCEGLRGENQLTLVHSDRALTDCRPLSFISLQTIRQIEAEAGIPIDPRRFRANIYLDLTSGDGFAEDEFVGRRLRIGEKAEIMVLERDPRCKMISLDPETGEHNPEILRQVAQVHENFAGVYCAVLIEGVLSVGDVITLVD